MNPRTIIIGAGIAGLTAAHYLARKGKEVLVLEASDSIGGRVKTDQLEGFLLDHGFQVFLTSYPEAKKLLDYKKLKLKTFSPGAWCIGEGSTRSLIGDPMRDFSTLFPTVFSGAATLGDKLKVWKLKKHVSSLSIEEIFSEPEISTQQYLINRGFSEQVIQNFFTPFYRGIFLDKDLSTSSRMFEFIFKMFSEGEAALPEAGMGAIPNQIASILAPDQIRLNAMVVDIKENAVQLESGEILEASAIIIAMDQSSIEEEDTSKASGNTTFYFSANKSTGLGRYIALPNHEKGLINSITELNAVQNTYSSSGKPLISVSVVGDLSLIDETKTLNKVAEQLNYIFKGRLAFEHLATYYVPYALPNQDTAKNTLTKADVRISESVFRCGDYLLNGSLNAAMYSGRIAAEAVVSSGLV